MRASKLNFYFYNVKNKLKLFAKNPEFILFYLERFRKYNSLEGFDAFIISYPKSGRTWLQKMMIETVRLEHDISEDLKEISSLNDLEFGLPKILSTHAGSSWEEVVLNSDEIKNDDLGKYKEGKIVFLYRDPRDVLVSQYYHIKNRSGFTNFRKEDMILNPNVGLLKIINFMNKWKKYAQQHPDLIYHFSYEDLKTNTSKTLTECLSFFNIQATKSNIKNAIANCELSKMRKAESANSDSPWTVTNNKSNPNSFHSRKGIVGEYLEFFNNSEIETIDSLIDQYLDDSFNY